jgi:putative hydrolase of HD superfamily
MLAVVHDLAEAQVGDITPDEGFSKQEKKQLEEVSTDDVHFVYISFIGQISWQDAINNFVSEMLHDSPAAKRIFALWKVRYAFISHIHDVEGFQGI